MQRREGRSRRAAPAYKPAFLQEDAAWRQSQLEAELAEADERAGAEAAAEAAEVRRQLREEERTIDSGRSTAACVSAYHDDVTTAERGEEEDTNE